MWDKGSLHELIEAKIRDYPMIVVANREPFIHNYEEGGETIACQRPASGMASALDPVMRASGGVWVGHGSGDADRAMVDEFDRVRVPPEDPSYTLRRVWLTKEEEEGYYHGLSNAGLWPLCHVTFTRPVFRPEHWEMYRRVNQLFGDAVLEEAAERPAFVFIQDYHFALLAAIPQGTKSEPDHRRSSGTFPGPTAKRFASFRGRKSCSRGCSATTCSVFTCATIARISSRPSIERSKPGSTRSRVRSCAGASRRWCGHFPISIDFERQEALARIERGRAGDRQDAATARPPRRYSGHRHRTD